MNVWTDFTLWLQQQFDRIIGYLDVRHWMAEQMMWLVNLLPDRSPVSKQIQDGFNSAVQYVLPYLQLISIVFPVQAFFAALGVMLVTEVAVGAFRAWRALRSTVV